MVLIVAFDNYRVECYEDKPMQFNILTLFPELYPGALGTGLMGKALSKGLWQCSAVNLRDFATNNYQSVDDTPFGGGAGMVIKPEIIASAMETLPQPGRTIYLSPRGKTLNQALVQELAQENAITLLCGRYEGVDQRALDYYLFEEVSIGDYVLSNGDLAAYVLMDAVIRLLPGVLGNAQTTEDESFSAGLLEYPHYTRPAIWQAPDGAEHSVPAVLQSGHHEQINSWRKQLQAAITQERRPDLWAAHVAQAAKSTRDRRVAKNKGETD